jgi:hypothetical protein
VKCELAAYQAACKRWPREAITPRQGGHIIEDKISPPATRRVRVDWAREYAQ